MVHTHKTTLLSSNCLGIGVIPVWRQRQQRLVSSLSLFPQFSSPPASPLFPPCDASLILSKWGERTDLDQLSSGFPKLKQPAHILDHISRSHYFFFFSGERERGAGCSLFFCTSAVGGEPVGGCLYDDGRAAVKNSWPVPRPRSQAGHHESREPAEAEVCYPDSSSGFVRVRAAVRQRVLHIC